MTDDDEVQAAADLVWSRVRAKKLAAWKRTRDPDIILSVTLARDLAKRGRLYEELDDLINEMKGMK